MQSPGLKAILFLFLVNMIPSLDCGASERNPHERETLTVDPAPRQLWTRSGISFYWPTRTSKIRL